MAATPGPEEVAGLQLLVVHTVITLALSISWLSWLHRSCQQALSRVIDDFKTDQKCRADVNSKAQSGVKFGLTATLAC